MMSSVSPTSAAIAFVTDVWNSPDGVARLDDWLSPTYRDHAYADDAEGLGRAIAELRTAFPDAQFEIEGLLEAGNHVALRLRLHGTHGGAFRDLEATGRAFDVKVFRWLRFDEGRVAEHWALLDTATLIRQLQS